MPTTPPSPASRERPAAARIARANGSSPARPRVVPPRRERKPSLIVAGLLLALVCGTVTAAIYLQVGGRSAVLVMARDVPVGQKLTPRDLTEARISYDRSLHAIPAKLRDQAVGRVAAVDLKAGSLLTREQLTTATVPGPGDAVVGVALKAGQFPADQPRPGDLVTVLLVRPASGGAAASARAPSGGSAVLVPVARVFSARASSATSNDVTVVSLVVRQNQVAAVARAQATGQVAIALLPVGTVEAGAR
jgi:Flp pilus assembly protein CpaB